MLVVCLADFAYTWSTAPLDLILKTGASSIRKHSIGAGAQQKRAVKSRQGHIHRVGGGKGTKVLSWLIPSPPMFGEKGVVMAPRDSDIA